MRRIGDPGSIDSPGCAIISTTSPPRSEEHTSELQSQSNLVCRLLLEKNKNHNTRGCPAKVAYHSRRVVSGLVVVFGFHCAYQTVGGCRVVEDLACVRRGTVVQRSAVS